LFGICDLEFGILVHRILSKYAIAIVVTDLYIHEFASLQDAFRYGGFQVVSFMTTTGFVTADYNRPLPLHVGGTVGALYRFSSADTGILERLSTDLKGKPQKKQYIASDQFSSIFILR
jgi:hypothetical protein